MTVPVRRGRRLSRAAAAASAALAFGVVWAPALVVVSAGGRGGVPGSGQADLLAAGGVVGLLAAGLAWRRVRRPGTGAATWIASLWGLATTALTASGLPPLALHALAGTLDPDAAWPAPVVWAACLLTAVAVGEAVHRAVHGWLADGPTDGRGDR